jgi:hypothetical protein
MRIKSRSRRAKAIVALTALFALTATAAALAAEVQAGKIIISIEGGITPAKLSKTKPTPITLKISGSVKTSDGSHVPALKTLDLEFDKHGMINTKGLATCSPSKLQATTTAAALKACSKELVGKGTVTAEIQLPEEAPFTAGGPLLIFNGPPQGGKPVLVMQVYAHVPAATTFVTKAVIGKAHGIYGTSTLVEIPTIVAGQGSLTSFSATLHKSWSYKGKKQSLLYASCPDGHLAAHGVFSFVEGTSISGNIVKPCSS